MIQKEVQPIPVVVPDKAQHAIKIDAAGEMLRIVVDDESLVVFAGVVESPGKQAHRVAIQRICLAMKLHQANVAGQTEVAGRGVFEDRRQFATLFTESDDTLCTLQFFVVSIRAEVVQGAILHFVESPADDCLKKIGDGAFFVSNPLNKSVRAGGVDRLRDEVAAVVELVRPQDLEGAGDVVPRGAITVRGVDHDRERRLRPALRVSTEALVMPLGLLDAKVRVPHAGQEGSRFSFMHRFYI